MPQDGLVIESLIVYVPELVKIKDGEVEVSEKPGAKLHEDEVPQKPDAYVTVHLYLVGGQLLVSEVFVPLTVKGAQPLVSGIINLAEGLSVIQSGREKVVESQEFFAFNVTVYVPGKV